MTDSHRICQQESIGRSNHNPLSCGMAKGFGAGCAGSGYADVGLPESGAAGYDLLCAFNHYQVSAVFGPSQT